MNKYLLLFTYLVLVTNLLANVNTKLVFISNVYNQPSANFGTLTFDVEAISNAGNVTINSFQNALDLDANFISRSPNVSFSNQLFPDADYNWGQGFSSGKITLQYTFDGGNRSTISGSTWTTVVRLIIQYSMAGINGAISWSNGLPNYYVTNSTNGVITGSEEGIPSQLQTVPLPVELSSFTASANQNVVNLKWETKTETDNYGFDVERKVGKSDIGEGAWAKIGFVPGNGNSNSHKEYYFTDKNPLGGSKFIYRLKQIDSDGKFEYSDKVEIELIPDESTLFQNYPNPFNPITIIKYALSKSAKVTLVVYSIIGERVALLLNEDKDAGFHQVSFDGRNLSSGTYIYRLTAGDFVQTKRMNLVK